MTIVFGSGLFGSGPYGLGSATPAPSSAFRSGLSGNAVELAINQETGDLALPPRFVRELDAISQRIRARLRFFLAEWFLDLRLGIPYFEKVLVKNPSLPVVSAIFYRVLKTTPGVASVSNISSSILPGTRTGLIDFNATLDDGLVLIAKNEPFIIPQVSP